MIMLHLALESDWAVALAAGTYRVSTSGLTLDDVGFIHCSTPAQVAGVASSFYADVTEPLRLLQMEATVIRASGTEVRLEDAGNGELFPHIYGAIDPSWVSQSRPAHMSHGLLVVG